MAENITGNGKGTLRTRQEIIDYSLTFPFSYEDYPFDDSNWTVMRRSDTKRGFAFIFGREGKIWVNLKIDPDWGMYFRSLYPSVLPAYHMNKHYWISVILDGTVPDDDVYSMINHSYEQCGKKAK